MRIISGTKRGMKLIPPKGNTTRPITDRAKESLFSVLYKYDVIEGGVVADLFCGTGSMGLECLSRGAAFSIFIDMDHKVIQLLNRNIEKTAFIAESKVIKGNIFRIGAPVPSGCDGRDRYDLVFVDPPYKLAYDTSLDSKLGRLLLMLNEQLTENAIVVVRANKRAEMLENYGNLHAIDHRQWGSMGVTLFQFKYEEQESDDTQSQDI